MNKENMDKWTKNKQFTEEGNCPINMRFSISQVIRGIRFKTMRYCSHLSDWQKAKRKVVISYKKKSYEVESLQILQHSNSPLRCTLEKLCTHAPVDTYKMADTAQL